MKVLKKITDKNILYVFTLCIIVFLPILKQLSFYFVKFNFIKNYDSINPIYIFCFCIPFLIYIYIKNLVKTKRKLDIFDYLFYILVIGGIIVSLLAIDKEISFLGKAYRHEGFISLISYYLLFITWKAEGNKQDIKKILNVIIVMTIINSVYGLLQIYSPFKWILRFTPDRQMASGMCGNPNFFGSLMVTTLSIVTTKYLIEEKYSIINITLIILFFISLIISQSTGPFLSYIITIIFLIIYLFIKKKINVKKIIYLIIILVVTYFTLFIINRQIFNVERCEMCDFTASLTGNEVSADNNGVSYTITNGRLENWKNSLNIAKKHLINGVGYDNFHIAYYEGVNLTQVNFVSMDGVLKAVPIYTEILDNAHNVYIHTLVTSGLMGLIPYLILCLLVFIKGLKTNNNLIIILLGGFVAYSIQAFANISVIHVAPIYYIIMGLMLIKE